jgi:hypothetical protein
MSSFLASDSVSNEVTYFTHAVLHRLGIKVSLCGLIAEAGSGNGKRKARK